jgi:hypothetical protein
MNRAIFLIFILLAGLARCQEGTQTLIKADNPFPAQGGPAAKLSFLGGPVGMLLGGRGALMLGENLALGVGGYSLATEVVTSSPAGIKRDVGFSYFGVTIDNFFVPRKLWFLGTSVLVGPGFGTGSQRNPAAEKDRTLFFVVEPEMNIMLNVTRELRIGLGLGFRLTAGSDITSVLGTDLGGISASFNLLYGKL